MGDAGSSDLEHGLQHLGFSIVLRCLDPVGPLSILDSVDGIGLLQ